MPFSTLIQELLNKIISSIYVFLMLFLFICISECLIVTTIPLLASYKFKAQHFILLFYLIFYIVLFKTSLWNNMKTKLLTKQMSCFNYIFTQLLWKFNSVLKIKEITADKECKQNWISIKKKPPWVWFCF